MAQKQPQQNAKTKSTRNTRRKSRQIDQEGSGEWVAANLGHQIGNRAVQRVVQSGRLEGEAPLAAFTPAQLRQAVLTHAGAAPAVQRDDAETLDAAAAAELTGDVTIEDVQPDNYEVAGTTLAEVGAQLDPEEWGRCRYQVDYHVETTGSRITRVDITLRLVIRMPVWNEGYNLASPAAKQEWQRMIRALQAHEDHHADIARRYAPIFQQRIMSVRASRAQAKYDEVWRELVREQRQYDATSRHGQAEGVSLDTSIQ